MKSSLTIGSGTSFSTFRYAILMTKLTGYQPLSYRAALLPFNIYPEALNP